MTISFVAGFGPVVRDIDVSRAFWEKGLGIGLDEPVPGYFTNDDLEGIKAFALWPRSRPQSRASGPMHGRQTFQSRSPGLSST